LFSQDHIFVGYNMRLVSNSLCDYASWLSRKQGRTSYERCCDLPHIKACYRLSANFI